MQKHEGWMDRGWGILGYRHNDEILHLSLLCICSWDVLHLFHHLLPTYCQALFTIIYLKRHNLTTKEIQLFFLTISCFWPVLLWRIWYNLHKVHRFPMVCLLVEMELQPEIHRIHLLAYGFVQRAWIIGGMALGASVSFSYVQSGSSHLALRLLCN